MDNAKVTDALRNINEWFNDCLAVLNIVGVQLELCAAKIDELAVSFNLIDMSEELNWYGIDDIKLEQRREPFPELLLVKDKRIINIELIEYNLQTVITFGKIILKQREPKVLLVF